MPISLKLTNLISSENVVLSDSFDNFSYVLPEIPNFGAAEGKNSYIQYINLIGSEIESTTIQPRDVSIIGYVVAKDQEEMTTRKAFLNKLINPLQDLRLDYDKYSIELRPLNSIKYGTTYTENNDVICKFMVSAVARVPLWKLTAGEVFYASKLQGTPLFPMIIPETEGLAFGILPDTSVYNVPNFGDVKVGFIAKLIAKDGEVTNPKITNNKTGEYIEVIINMAKGDEVEISTISGNKYVKFVRGSTETDIFRFVTRKSTMNLTLNTGTNDILIDAVGNSENMASSISFSPMWMEVQQ